MLSHSIAILLQEATQKLTAISDTAGLDSEVLLLYALNSSSQNNDCSRAYLRTWPEFELSSEQYQLFKNLLQQRLKGVPIAYIMGNREFWSMHLEVNESTLIPRPETETLVEAALLEIPEQARWNILDLGTGSGAIALAIAAERPNCQIFAMDVSFKALRTAQRNAKNHIESINLNNLHFFCGDWLAALPENYFHLIASNPPYIHNDDPHLQQGDVRFEPVSALTSGPDGLDDIKQILQQAPKHLRSGAHIFIEHGYNQAASIKTLFAQNHYQKIRQHQDLSGVIRVSSGEV